LQTKPQEGLTILSIWLSTNTGFPACEKQIEQQTSENPLNRFKMLLSRGTTSGEKFHRKKPQLHLCFWTRYNTSLKVSLCQKTSEIVLLLHFGVILLQHSPCKYLYCLLLYSETIVQ